MKKSIKAPFEILVVIIKRGLAEKASEFLKRHSSNFHLISMAEGTAESEIMEFFGFGMSEREVLFGLIDATESKHTLDMLGAKFDFETPTNGIALTLPLTSATNVMMEMAVKGLISGGEDGE